jgi:hypothetical protein
VRASILIWSAVSGLVLGLFAGVVLFAVPVTVSELTASFLPRLGSRARTTLAVVSFAVLPLAGATLGFLEGRLKLR